jgi:hypothetical protein
MLDENYARDCPQPRYLAIFVDPILCDLSHPRVESRIHSIKLFKGTLAWTTLTRTSWLGTARVDSEGP